MEALPLEVVPAQPVSDRRWYQIWWDVWTHPGKKSFEDLLTERRHSRNRGYAWVCVAGIAMVIYLIYTMLSSRNISIMYGVRYQTGAMLVQGICLLILVPLFYILLLLISTAFFHLFAKVFGGHGKWDELVICLAVVSAPRVYIGILAGLIPMLFFPDAHLGVFPTLISFVIDMYLLVLFAFAVRVTEKLGTGGMIGTVIIPGAILIILNSGFAIFTGLNPQWLNSLLY